ncbi:MAG: hypothetical protein AMXMBFR51_21130 [Ignavibacteriota bacterium]
MKLANDDLIKVNKLRSSVPKKIIYETFYLVKVTELNQLLDTIAYLKSLD